MELPLADSCIGGHYLEQVVYNQPEYAQGSLVFEAFGGLVEFLQSKFCVVVEFFVVNQCANRTLALVNLFQDLAEIGHR